LRLRCEPIEFIALIGNPTGPERVGPTGTRMMYKLPQCAVLSLGRCIGGKFCHSIGGRSWPKAVAGTERAQVCVLSGQIGVNVFGIRQADKVLPAFAELIRDGRQSIVYVFAALNGTDLVLVVEPDGLAPWPDASVHATMLTKNGATSSFPGEERILGRR